MDSGALRLSFVMLFVALPVFALACAGGGDDDQERPLPIIVETLAPAAEASPVPAAAETPTVAPGRITLNATGDVMLARDIITLMEENGALYPYAAVRSLLADADITIANMEGTFTERGEQASKFYTFRTPPRFAVGLKEAGIDVVSLSNNHTMDFGNIGLADTIAALNAANVKHSGAGMNAAEARTPVVLDANGLKVAFLSYEAVSESTPAGPSSPGVAWAYEADVRADVTAAKQAADIVVVSLHAGTEYQDTPVEVQRRIGRVAIDAGATLVLGHHPHVFQGWQKHGTGIIVYSLGNFVFDLDSDDLATLGPRPFQTAILHFELSKAGVENVTARPVFIDPVANRPRPATPDEAAAIEERIRRLNAALN